MNILLKPNLSEAIYLSRAQARRIGQIEGLSVTLTLQPVAIPGLEFLNSILDTKAQHAMLPGHIIDAVSLQKIETKTSFHGAAVCCGCFKDRFVIC